ncbi:MAG TPA: tetratricopeptide repeat protein [Acidobacteriaceae bacterium]|nr:tetratricopeptide repeat protein [Acidobacteriaceae bacterium]
MPCLSFRFVLTAVLICLPALAVNAQASKENTVHGTVLDSAGKPVAGALVKLGHNAETKTDAAGDFQFSGISGGSYQISARKAERTSHPETVVVGSGSGEKPLKLLLVESLPAVEFVDDPNFAVAGVTDWTAAGGHGSDSTLRTSEDLARETLALKQNGSAHANAELARDPAEESKLRAALAGMPGSFAANHQLGAFYLHAGRFADSIPLLMAAYQIDPSNQANEYDLAIAYKETGDFSRAREHVQTLLARHESGDLHRLLAEIDEKTGDSLSAVHEEEQAVRLDPSEQNYFAWGSELLLHRAIWQAAEVFKNGTKAYPKSARMLAALGTAQFSGDLYDQAGASLCAASDLNPADPELYIFMSRIEMAAPKPLPCVKERLARFVRLQPGNPLANYAYAMAIWKRQGPEPDAQVMQQVEALLTKAVTLDTKCADAYLQLGILSFSRRQPQKAVDYYLKAIGANSQLSEAHYRLAVAYDRMGMAEKAQQEFQIHDQIAKAQAAAVERQRREVKQFLVVLEGQPGYPKAAK